MPCSSSKAAPEQCRATTCHKLARNHKQQTLALRFSRFETMMRRAGWVTRRRPLAGPLSPCGSQPATRTLPGRFVSPNGPAGLPAGVRESRYKGSTLAVTPVTGEAATGRFTGLRPYPPFQLPAMCSRILLLGG